MVFPQVCFAERGLSGEWSVLPGLKLLRCTWGNLGLLGNESPKTESMGNV